MAKVKKMKVCCLCGKCIEGEGNNPFPLDREDGAVCCDGCNDKVVIPTRLLLMKLNKR